MNDAYNIQEFVAGEANETDFSALHQFSNKMRAERLPNDPPRSLQVLKANLLALPPFVNLRMWLVWNAAETAVLGQGVFVHLDTEDNQHLGQVEIGVLAEHRRQGLGKALLAFIAEEATAKNRRLLISDTNGRVPAGEKFALHLGASKGLSTHVNQLAITQIDNSLVKSWSGSAPKAEFSIGAWQGPYPDEQLENIMALHDVMNQQPLDDLDVEDSHFTEEQIRQMEARLAAQGVDRWTIFVQDGASGKLAGYTQIFFQPDLPMVGFQGDTGVFHEFRGRGLGKWLKAAMLEKIVAERPSVQFIRTTNADSNAAMLNINQKLGFEPYYAQTVWQIETAKVKAYLAEE